jgi:energy-coupling factor transporter transmembrane protein EcfT
MNKFFKYCFDKWWRPLIFFTVTCLLFVFSLVTNNYRLENFMTVFLGLGLLVILISAIYNFIKRRWIAGILNLALFGGAIIALVFYVIALFLIEEARPDTFTDNLTIPTNIPINIPADLDFDEHRPDSILNRPVKATDFQLYNSFQPGLYEYDFWTGETERGAIYLKAYEITQNYALSTDRLPKSSEVVIYNPSATIKKFGTMSHFTIYEGDWGKPYAARFEVWFRPDNGKNERKLFSKNYKIEGWMR